MGYDCTLHVVDENFIRDRFVPRLLGTSRDKLAFDGHADAPALWEQVTSALDGDEEPVVAANMVCQLAVVACAAEDLPYHYERGFCLSLWRHQPDGLDAAVPKKFLGDPAALFEAVTARYPRLEGEFPREIEENFSTGCFVPREHVPPLLAWVEKRVRRYPKPDQRLFRGLLLVLRRAAQQGLAYWEGTDLPVPMKSIEPETRSGAAEEVQLPGGYATQRQRVGDVLVISQGPGKDCWTCFCDITTWPPRVRQVAEYTVDADRSPGGRLLSISASAEHPYRYRASVRRGAWDAEPELLALDGPDEQLGLAAGGFFGEAVLAIRKFEKDHRLPGTPLIERSGRLVPLAGEHVVHRSEPKQIMAAGTIRLADGGDVVVWNDEGYELRDGALTRTFPKLAHPEGLTFQGVPWGPDGFLYIGHDGARARQLFHARRGQPPSPPLAPRIDNAMLVEPGPPGGVLLKQGDNRKGYVGVILYPDQRTYVPLEPELFPDEDPDHLATLHWADQTARLIATTPYRIWAVDLARVMSLPRYHLDTGRKLK